MVRTQSEELMKPSLDKWDSLGQLIKIIRENQMDFVVDKLIDFSASKDDELRDISGLGMRHLHKTTTFVLYHKSDCTCVVQR